MGGGREGGRQSLGHRGLGWGSAFERRGNQSTVPLLSSSKGSDNLASLQELTNLLPSPSTCCSPRGRQCLRRRGDSSGFQVQAWQTGVPESTPSSPPLPTRATRGTDVAASPGLMLTHLGTSGGPHSAYPTDLFSRVHFAFPWFGEEGRNGAGTGREEPAASAGSGDNEGRGG